MTKPEAVTVLTVRILVLDLISSAYLIDHGLWFLALFLILDVLLIIGELLR